MNETREVFSEREIKDIITKLQNCGRFEEGMIAIARKDLEYGLTKAEVEIYLKDGFSIHQMETISKAIRKHGSGFAEVIAKADLDAQSMELAMDYYEKGVSLDDILSGVNQKTSAYNLNLIYSSMLSTIRNAEKQEVSPSTDMTYVEKLLEEMKEIVISINRNAERYDALNDKFRQSEMEKQVQKEQMEYQVKIARMEQEAENLKETVRDLKEKLAEKEGEIKEMKSAEKTQPVEYMAAFTGVESRHQMKMLVESYQPKRTGLYTLLGKLAYKKKSKQDIVRLVANGELSTKQLSKIRLAMSKGLTEEQLLELIHSGATPEQMEEIIEIAALQNSMR